MKPKKPGIKIRWMETKDRSAGDLVLNFHGIIVFEIAVNS